MKSVLGLVLIVYSFINFSCEKKQELMSIGSDYFPLQIGNEWVLSIPGSKEQERYSISKSEYIGDRNYFSFRNYDETNFEYQKLIRKDAIGNVFVRFDPETQIISLYSQIEMDSINYSLGDQLMYKFSGKVGDSWKALEWAGGIGDDKYQLHMANITIMGKNETIKTPIGVFANCIQFRFEFPHAFFSFNYDIWFSKGIGIVKMQYLIAEENYRILASYKLN